ncbi:MAG: amidohydrolase [Gemmatimonadetes bacterium]|nr:amidohydrolase [Gemmatimonadota bacterium]
MVSAAAVALLATVARAQPADAVYLNARIWTGDAARPTAAALAVRDGRLLVVGSAAAVRARIGPATQVVDLGGKRVVPGFIDSHWHLPTTSRADLLGAGSPDSIVARLQRWSAALPADEWILGRGWTPADFPDGAADRRALDAAFPDRPVYLTDRDGHQALANGAALRRAGVTAASVAPAGGVIEHDATGAPSGLLKEAAMSLVGRLVPPPSRAALALAIDRESRAAASFGLTLLQEASAREARGDVFELLTAAAAADTLRVRWRWSVPFRATASDDELRAWRALADSARSPWLRFGIAKGMLDGTVDARTAVMLTPFTGVDTLARPFMTASLLQRTVARYDSAGLQVQLHAIGDGAIRMALDAFARLTPRRGTPAAARDQRRHRIEHLEVPHPADLPRFRQLGVIASTQALFATPDVTTLTNYAPLLGPTRAARANNFRALDRAGAVQAFGSDYPVFPMDVLLGIYTAVTRTLPDGTPRGGWQPAGRITVEAALRHFTRDAAYAAFMERDVGMLRAGLQADFVVLSQDILALPPAALLTTRVERTVVGGREAYRAPPP